MSKENATDEETKTGLTYEEVLETIETRKKEVATIQAELNGIKEEQKVKTLAKIKDAKVLTKVTGLQKEKADLQADITKLEADAKLLKPKGTGGFEGKYDYPSMKVEDKETKELREMTSVEKKRWRTKARRESKKLNCTPEQVPFNPNFLSPAAKVEKPKKADKAAKEEETAGESTEATKGLKKIVKKPTAKTEEADD